MVATYRGSDADPKERFVHHQAGASGDGGSSYIDLVAFREKDVDEAWTDASDGDLEERLYYCQNQHADVVALITSAGAQREMARYSAYGVPFGLPVGDVNSDGDCDQADQNQARDWALATPAVYDVRGDLDLDGDVDLTDRDTLRDNYKGVTLGRGVLSAPLVRNQRGVAGYVAAGYGPSTYLIRHRVFPSELGVWASRDPLGYVDGECAYSFVDASPLRFLDPTGEKLVVRGSDSFKAAVAANTARLRRTEVGRLVLRRLETAQQTIEIVDGPCDPAPAVTTPFATRECTRYDFGPGSFEVCTWRLTGVSIICWDPASVLTFGFLPDVVLIHEMFHADQILSMNGRTAEWYHANEVRLEAQVDRWTNEYKVEAGKLDQ